MAIQTTKVSCQGCGASLEVSEDITYVTCNYCSSRLEVIHDSSVTHTRVLETLAKNTEAIAGNLKVIELQNDLELLDREWEQREDGFMVTGRHGHRSLPDGGHVVAGVAAAIFGVFWILFTSSIARQMGGGIVSIFPLFGVLFVIMAIFTAVTGGAKANAYKDARGRHQRRRSDLLAQIEAARDGRGG